MKMIDNEDGATSPLMMTNEQLVVVCERMHAAMQKKAKRLRKKLDREDNDENLAAFVAAAEELYAFERVIKLCEDLGKKVTMLVGANAAPLKTIKKQDIN